MKIVIAIDSFKGCLSSMEANEAAAEGVKDVCKEADIKQVAVSDGGEGFLSAYHAAIGGEFVELTVMNPLMRPVRARYLLKNRLAVIEMAEASGLTLIAKEERNPMMATTYGTGQLIADAVKKGVERIIVGLGGSATCDAGQGMLQALIDNFSKNGEWEEMDELKRIRFTIASDVRNPLCGEHGAARVFAPQKGATQEMVELLEARAKQFADASARRFGFDRSEEAGAGAAGGLGYALMQYLDADCQSGIDLLLETMDFEKLVCDADCVVTGEGSADRQTLMGKLPMGVLRHAGKAVVCLIAGQVNDRQELLQAGFAHVECVNPPEISLEEAMRPDVAKQNIRRTVCEILKTNSIYLKSTKSTE